MRIWLRKLWNPPRARARRIDSYLPYNRFLRLGCVFLLLDTGQFLEMVNGCGR